MNAVKCRLNAFLFCVLKKQEKIMNSKNLIKKSCFALIIIALLTMVCLCACAVSNDASSGKQTEKKLETKKTDIKAPEGVLKGNFLVAWVTLLRKLQILLNLRKVFGTFA